MGILQENFLRILQMFLEKFSDRTLESHTELLQETLKKLLKKSPEIKIHVGIRRNPQKAS